MSFYLLIFLSFCFCFACFILTTPRGGRMTKHYTSSYCSVIPLSKCCRREHFGAKFSVIATVFFCVFFFFYYLCSCYRCGVSVSHLNWQHWSITPKIQICEMQHHDFPVCLFGSVSVEECKPACIVKCHVLIHVYQL